MEVKLRRGSAEDSAQSAHSPDSSASAVTKETSLAADPNAKEDGEVVCGPFRSEDSHSLNVVEEPRLDARGRDVLSNVMQDPPEECPICTEPYDPLGDHQRALLNCSHTLCHPCMERMLSRSSDSGRLLCPLCRQNTPLPEWEIRHMQNEALHLLGSPVEVTPPSQAPPPQELGGFSALERRLGSRAELAMLCGCFPPPPGLIRGLRRLRNHSRCCYITGLALICLADSSCLLMLFLPVLVLVLLFTLARWAF